MSSNTPTWSRLPLKEGEEKFSNIEQKHADNYNEFEENTLDAVSVKKIVSI